MAVSRRDDTASDELVRTAGRGAGSSSLKRRFSNMLPLLLPLLLRPLFALDWAKGPPDRFTALRFSCPGTYDARAFALAVRDRADALSAFGWVQVSRGGAGPVVGEFRGALSTGAAFEALLAAGPPGAGRACDTRRYPGALIRLHFADFKLLTEDRDTCFEDEPHKCGEDEGGSGGDGSGGDEL